MNKQMRYLILAVLTGIIGGLILLNVIDNLILRVIAIAIIVFIIGTVLEMFKPEDEKQMNR